MRGGKRGQRSLRVAQVIDAGDAMGIHALSPCQDNAVIPGPQRIDDFAHRPIGRDELPIHPGRNTQRVHAAAPIIAAARQIDGLPDLEGLHCRRLVTCNPHPSPPNRNRNARLPPAHFKCGA